MPPEKAPNPDLNEEGTPGYKDLFPEPKAKSVAGGGEKAAEGAAASKGAARLVLKS